MTVLGAVSQRLLGHREPIDGDEEAPTQWGGRRSGEGDSG